MYAARQVSVVMAAVYDSETGNSLGFGGKGFK